MRGTRVIVSCASLLIALCVGVGAASAAPTNAKKADFVELICDNGTTYSIVVNGNGQFSPGHILDAEGNNLIPVWFNFLVVDESGEVLFDVTVAKPGEMNGLSGDLMECTFTEIDEGLTINGTVMLFVVPRG
jgi:hypothetical protein